MKKKFFFFLQILENIMLVNQTGNHHRRVLRTEIDDSSPMKKPKKLTPRRKLFRHADPKPMKKERKKRMKKLSEQETNESKTDSRTSITFIDFHPMIYFVSDDPSLPLKDDDDLINNCSLLHSPSLSQPMFDSIIDHNQFWHSNQIITPTDYYLPVNSLPFDQQHHLSPSDMDNSNSSMPDNSSKTMNNGQSRKDKSLGLLCQR